MVPMESLNRSAERSLLGDNDDLRNVRDEVPTFLEAGLAESNTSKVREDLEL